MAGFLSKSQVEYQAIFEFALMEWIRCTPCPWAQRARGHWAENEHGNKHKIIYFFLQWFRFHISFIIILITKRDIYYYKMRQLFYHNMRWKLITKCARAFITKYASFIKKRDSYYKMWSLLQNASVHGYFTVNELLSFTFPKIYLRGISELPHQKTFLNKLCWYALCIMTRFRTERIGKQG